MRMMADLLLLSEVQSVQFETQDFNLFSIIHRVKVRKQVRHAILQDETRVKKIAMI